ncbi:MAG: PqiC family protein, partial [Candidatus Omnitrophica bacterium]|nr:PqiC family protein [Candidatus Omnitrophota bacterium]
IIQLDSELDKDLLLVAQWTVIDTQDSKTIMIKRSEFRHPIIPQNYSGLVKTLSIACGSLSKEIADELEPILNAKKEAQKSKE